MATEKIRIPKGVPLAVAKDKPLRKAVASLLMLKFYYEDQGHVMFSEMNAAAEKLCISRKTLWRRTQILEARKLITPKVDCGGAYYLCDYDRLRDELEIKESGFYYAKDTGRDMVDVLEALAMRAPVDKQHNAYYSWIKYTPGLKQELTEVAGGYNASAVLDAQLFCFKTEGRCHTERQRYLLGVVGADFSVNTYTYNEMFGYRGIGSMAYKKRKLSKVGLITVEHRWYELEGHTTRRSRETSLGDVLPPVHGSGRTKPILVMPDKITFLPLSAPLPVVAETLMDKI